MTMGFEPETLSQLQNMGLTDEEIRWLIENYRGTGWLEQQLVSYINEGRISQEQAATLFDSVMNNVPVWERQVSAWEEKKEAQAALWEKEKQRQEARATHLSRVLEEYQSNPVVAPYLKDIRQSEIDEYVSGQSDELLSRLSLLWTGAYEAQRAPYREAAETQRGEALLAGITGAGKRPREERAIPSKPGTEDIRKAFLGETGLGKGTRLRSFLEQEFIPEVMKETAGERERWWRAMHEPREESSAEKRRRHQTKAFELARTAFSPDTPTSEIFGGVFYGEGGLKGIAEMAYRSQMKALAGLGGKRSSRGRRPEPGEDPLIAALRAKRFRPEYYRGAGTGLVSRLTPAVRY